MTSIARRSLLTAAGAGGVVGALGACAPPLRGTSASAVIPPADDRVTITYWAWSDKLQQVADIFNASQDRITVEVSWIPAGRSGGNAKTLSAVAAGGGPDIAQVELRSIPEFLLAGALTDITPYDFLDEAARYLPSAFEQVTLGDRAWGVPVDMGPCVMYYNRDVLENELGVSAPTTWDEFRTTSQLAAEAGKNFLALNPNDGVVIPMWAMQAGAQWFTAHEDGWTIAMTDEATMQVAEFWDQMIADGTLVTSYGTGATPWMTGAGEDQHLAHIGGSWSDGIIKSIPNAEGRWAVAPMPRWEYGYGSAQNGGSGAGVMANSRHPHEAVEFLTWMTGTKEGVDALIDIQNIGWPAMDGFIGTSRQDPDPFYDQPSDAANPNVDVVKPMSEDQNVDWVWPPLTQRLLDVLGDQFVAVVGGETTFVEAMPAAQEQVTTIMRNKGLTVEVQK